MSEASDDSRSDRQLIDAIKGGDDSAFDALYRRYRDWVLRLARRSCGNSEDALDVLQETFAYLAGKFPGFVLTAAMTTFLYPVVRNLSIASRKKTMRFTGSDLADKAALDQPSPQSQKSELAALLDLLPEAHREVLLLRFADGLSLEEIAGAMEIPLGTVKSRLHNAISQLRQEPRIKDYFGRPK